MAKADFYTSTSDPEWIGSITDYGEPWNIPPDILIQNNSILYEELVIEWMKENDFYSYICSHDQCWPWDWEDSKLTDYSYFFCEDDGKVYAYSRDDDIVFDPVNVYLGDDLRNSQVDINIVFPTMVGVKELNGLCFAKVV